MVQDIQRSPGSRKGYCPASLRFWLNVHLTTLYRLKSAFESKAPEWLSDAFDTAAEVLVSDEAANMAPLRETLSTILYSRAIYCAENCNDIPTIDRLISAIARVEKLKAPPQPTRSAPRPSTPPPPTRHRVELTIVPAHQHPQPQRAEIISVQPMPLPDNKSADQPPSS